MRHSWWCRVRKQGISLILKLENKYEFQKEGAVKFNESAAPAGDGQADAGCSADDTVVGAALPGEVEAVTAFMASFRVTIFEEASLAKLSSFLASSDKSVGELRDRQVAKGMI